MTTTTTALTSSPEQGFEYPQGLTPPSQRRRSARLIGDVIVELGFASRDVVENAVAASRVEGKPTGQILLEWGELRYGELARALAERFGVDFIDLSTFDIDLGAVNLLTAEAARHYQAVPVAFLSDQTLLVAMADPANVLTLDEISMITGRRVRPAAASAEDLAALIGRLSRFDEAIAAIDESAEAEDVELALAPQGDQDAPVIKLVQSIIRQAIEQGASDIHCDPDPAGMQVLFRVDGVLTRAATISRSMRSGVVSRIKVMANLDISERRLPQDGRLAVTVDGRRVDVRVVTLPLVNGEGVTMRILDTSAVVRDLEILGMRGAALEHLQAALKRPYGAVLVTGPTGSGKTTTLYGALAEFNDGVRAIMTIEDPVESQIAGTKQMQVATKAGVTFASGLRTMLRADPDVIMVGEIRDRETAEISVQAALTGHLVLSTLHTRDAASALTRLIDMGIEPFMVAASIDCVVAQRLARTLCGECKRPAQLPRAVRARHGLGSGQVFEPVGCIRCSQTGYRGRIGLYEVMPVSDEIRALVLDRRGPAEIAAVAAEQGMQSMRDDGLRKVCEGITSLVEVARVTTVL
jgi:type IV pilus assembly protein PilB